MARRSTEKNPQPANRDALLEEALSRPGVREAMEVYQNWRKADRHVADWRAASTPRLAVTTTDRVGPPRK